jgi:hypothetical protein
MAVLIFTLLIGAWAFVIAGQLNGFLQFISYVIAAWFLLAALWNAWQMSREN